MNKPPQVEAIFFKALEKKTAEERAAYLDSACEGNAEIRRQVEKLLNAYPKVGDFLANPVAEQMAPDATQDMAFSTDGEGTAEVPRREASVTRTADGESDSDEETSLEFLQPSTRPDSLGRLGHYEVLQVLGRGGFGIVFRAFDDVLQRVVAVKVMAPQMAATSPARRRFLREARSSAAIRHENVVQVYEVGEQPLPYLVMEFIPGETLQQKLDRSGPLEVLELLRISRQVAEGLAAAHACDLIHRDIKPGNVLLEGGSHKVKITDFGLARAADDASISQSGVIAGTPMFMSPEQALGHQIDQRADLFSLGSVLYQMASGRPPFRAPTALAVLKRVAEEPPRPIPEIIPETPAWLCGIITKLHAKNPADRFQSAREVADLLADCEAKLKAKQEVKNILPSPASKPAGRKWVAAAVVLLLPVIALAVTEFAGLTHLFRQQAPLDHDRKAAEYVLSIGGQVQVDDRDRKINVASELPRDPFRLTWIGLMHSNRVTDAGLANLKDCQNLTFLGLFDTSVSDEGLANFQNSTKLTFLNLSRTKISDAGLANFKNCTELTIVVLNETSVSDTGLAYLKNSKKLTKLLLLKTKVTAAGIGELKQALPLCKIDWDGGVSESAPVVVPPTFKNSIDMEFVIVPKGKSWLGGEKDKPGDKEVVIPADFYLGKYEVTQEEWTKVMGENPSHFSRTGGGNDAVKDISDADLKRFPVENVSWHRCQIFVAKLNKLEKETGWVYRLPMEAEWEYACRGGPMADKPDSSFDFYFAKPTNTLLPEQANFNNGLNRTCKVGSYESNRLGLFDIHGNVWEWCEDTEKAANGALERVYRGGCWQFAASDSRAAHRYALSPSFPGNSLLGLRLARVPSSAASPEVKTPQPDTTAWNALKPVEMKSSGGATLALEKDGSILVSGEHPNQDSYTITFRDLPAKIQTVRLEVLPHDSLPNKGPSRNPSHPFVLSTIRADIDVPGKKGEPGVLKFSKAWSDGGFGDDSGPQYAIDMDENTGWGTEVGKPHFAVFELAEPLMAGEGTVLRVTLDFKHDVPQRQLGCFRLSFSKEVWTEADLKKTVFEDWLKRVATLPATEQIEEVRTELKKRNPDFGGQLTPTIEKDAVVGLMFLTDQVADISPVRALTRLKKLVIHGMGKGLLEDLSPLTGMRLTWLNVGENRVSDLTPLKGMPLESLELWQWRGEDLTPLKGMPLKWLNCGGYNQKLDLAPLAGMPLEYLCVNHSQVSNLAPLKDTPLTRLECQFTQVSDLAPLRSRQLELLWLANSKVSDLTALKGMPLKDLSIEETPVADLSPLKGMPLEDILLTPKNITQGLNILREMKSLRTIGISASTRAPAAEFWTRVNKGEFKTSSAATVSETWIKTVAALPAAEQVKEVHKELKRLNPKFDGTLTPTFENNVVTGLQFLTDEVVNIAPLRALKGLTSLDCRGTYLDKGKLSDLSPLKGMNLSWLDCSSTQISDLTPLAGMPLKFLQFNHNPVSDLKMLKGMPLEVLGIAETKASDLSPLKGMKLHTLGAQLLPVTDLTPLQGMPLKFLDLYQTIGVTNLEPLKGMPLELLNLHDVPVSDLSALKGMTSLQTLNLESDALADLSPLQGLKLRDLFMRGKKLSDLSPLKGMPLARLEIYGTGVTDLRPLQGMELTEMRLTPKNITQGLEMLRELKSLKTIGTDGNRAWPAAEFWERYKKGEFKE